MCTDINNICNTSQGVDHEVNKVLHKTDLQLMCMGYLYQNLFFANSDIFELKQIAVLFSLKFLYPFIVTCLYILPHFKILKK